MEQANSRFLSLDDLTHMKQPAWLIDGLIEANTLVMLAGPPASYKSFLALDWIMCMASGRKWLERPTTPSKILYVLGEGKSSLLKRVHAWSRYNRVQQDSPEWARMRDNFRVTFDVPQMALKSSVDNMLSGLTDEKYFPNVIVVDTFARSFVGLDENSQKDTGMWVEQAERLRALGYTVIFLHHTRKNSDFGLQYRGSTAIMGAMDTAMTMQRESGPTRTVLHVTKQKDHDEGDPIHFQRVIVPLDNDPEGSVVLVPSVSVDERFTEEYKKVEEAIVTLMANDLYDSDRARARDLSQMTGITESAAQTRISRHRQHGASL